MDEILQRTLDPFLRNGYVRYMKPCFGNVGIGQGWTLTFVGSRICYIRTFGRIRIYRDKGPFLCIHIGDAKGHVIHVWFNKEQEREMWISIVEIEELRMLRNIVLRSI